MGINLKTILHAKRKIIKIKISLTLTYKWPISHVWSIFTNYLKIVIATTEKNVCVLF